FIASEEHVVEYLRYNMRSQIFAKSLPMALVVGALKRLDLIRKHPEFKENLWKITNALQSGLTKAGFNIGNTQSCVTPVILSGTIPEATNLIIDLRENSNIFCSIVVYPVVPKGVIMLRLIPTAVHTIEDVNYTIECFSKAQIRLQAGEYKADKVTIG
ncbi:MAG TPA: aminotransferase class I/II-fold pyridoxal phosphate-dependent enzyme, partial [Bacteroidia bacterium]|nr:aminotransferase class I/II-fold pyridoxal phosphate-dependent enzyme [Bacteroidia bacterium]